MSKRIQTYDANAAHYVASMEPVARELDFSEADAWALAEAEIAALPPYLGDDELTAERLYAKHKETISKQDAEKILEKLSEPSGPLVKVDRRNPKGGSHIWAYVEKKAAASTAN